MRKINEIFYSLQGEGFHTGTPALFIRFSGCNLKCPFCDTPHETGTWMSDEEIMRRVAECPAQTVILTGGEPSLWISDEFIDQLHNLGKYVCIETNGVLERIDEVKVVFTGEDVEPYASLPARYHYLQPCSCQNTQAVVDYILEHPFWRLSLQTHKYIQIQ